MDPHLSDLVVPIALRSSPCCSRYLGQADLILHRPESIANPFFLLFPDWGRLPIVLLATAATLIASQSVISGAFSVTRQAVQLGFLSHMRIQPTRAPGMRMWRKKLFVTLARNAASPVNYVALADDRTIIMGWHVDV